MNQDTNPLMRLAMSSKAIVVLAVTALTFVAVFKGQIQWHDASELLKWVLGPWLIAQGAEDAAKHMRRTPSQPPSQDVPVEVDPPTSESR